MRIVIAGDYYVTDPEKVSIGAVLRNLINEADYSIINFEAPIASSSYKEVVKKSGPRLSQPDSNANWLKEAGFGILTFANNHLLDCGIEGYQHSIDVLSSFDVMGCGTWEEAYSVKILEEDGLRVGLLNLCELQFGMLYDEWSQPLASIGCSWINHPKVNAIIRETKTKVDYLIAITHAGLEMVDVPLPEWRDRYREMINMGCDAIVGGHPHVPQGYEIYNGKPIFYSLGNFCFSTLKDFSSDKWNIGEMLSLVVTKAKLTFKLVGIEYKDDNLNIMDDNRWNEQIKSLNGLLSHDKYMPLVNEICTSKLGEYWTLFNMGGLIHPDKELPKSIARHILNKYDHVHLLNLLQCESHRWCISRGIRIE